MKTKIKMVFILILISVLNVISSSNALEINILDNTNQSNINYIYDDLPTIQITKPKVGFLYFNFGDLFEFKFPFITTLIIGKSDIEAEVTKGIYEIDKVEFYINENPKASFNNEPYRWTWNEYSPLTTYQIKAIVYDTNGYQTSDVMNVWKCQYIEIEESLI